jgi:CDP-glucose 4,6-dehydratase
MEGVGMIYAFWIDRPIFFTCGKRLVGRWLVRRLIEAGTDVVYLVRDWGTQCELNHSKLIEKVKVDQGDIRDQALHEGVLGKYDIFNISNRNPVSMFESNISETWARLEACCRNSKVG